MVSITYITTRLNRKERKKVENFLEMKMIFPYKLSIRLFKSFNILGYYSVCIKKFIHKKEIMRRIK